MTMGIDFSCWQTCGSPTINHKHTFRNSQLHKIFHQFVEHRSYLCRYYSSTTQKYLKLSFCERSTRRDIQLRTLVVGFQIAFWLNRTLIFPKFFWRNRHQNFLGLFGNCIDEFDEHNNLDYRENMFLHNPLVPKILVSLRANNVILNTEDLDYHIVQNYFLHQQRSQVIHIRLFHNVSAMLNHFFQTFLETMQTQHCKSGKNF